MTGTLGPLDLAVVGVYLAATVGLGVRRTRRGNGQEDFLLAGRTLTLPAFVVTLVATWYGGVLGVGEYSYLHGISNWLVLGVPYYIGALLFALLFAERAREVGASTLPDLLYGAYGRGAGALGALMVLASSLPAPYLLMLGVLLSRATGLPQAWAIAASAVFCLLYIGARGFRSVVQTKGLQFALMYGGFVLLLPIAVFHAGGIGTVRAAVPAESFSVLGGQTVGYVVAWYFIALQTLVEPTFFQRCFAAKSPAVARRGLYVSIVFFAIFDGLTTFTGIYARALLPNLSSGVEAFPALGELLLPAGLLGVFYAGMLATVMSTVDSYLFNAGISISRDLAGRLGRRAATTLSGERVGLVVATGIAVAFALSSSSVVNLWYGFGSVATAVLLAPICGVFFPKVRPHASFVAPGMVVSGAVALAWVLSGLRAGGPWLGIEPVYPGLVVSGFIAAAGAVSRSWSARPAP